LPNEKGYQQENSSGLTDGYSRQARLPAEHAPLAAVARLNPQNFMNWRW
jgi:hypothetical protein